MPSVNCPGSTVRQMLDYICWICKELQVLGAHGGSALEHWRKQVGVAYRAMVNPMLAGYGDPYPPDVPPARSPGLWPDVAASDLPGMTVRHQLVVVAMLAEQSRAGVGLRARPEVLSELEARIARARSALDHGPQRPIPAEAQTEPSQQLLAAAQAEEKAIREHARRRTRQVRSLLSHPRGAHGRGKHARAKGPARKASAGRRAGAGPKSGTRKQGPRKPAARKTAARASKLSARAKAKPKRGVR